MGPVLECVLEKKGKKRDDSSLRRKYHHLLVQNPMTITMDDLFRSKLPPKEAKLLCVCVCGCLFTQRRTTRGEKVADAQRLPSAPRNTPESGRQGVCVNNNKPSPTHALTPEQTPFSSRNIFKRKKKKEKNPVGSLTVSLMKMNIRDLEICTHTPSMGG